MFCAGTSGGEGNYTVTVSLWNADGSDLPTGGAIATDTWTLSSVSRSTSVYFTHDFGSSSSFVVSGNSKYSLTFEVTSYTTSGSNSDLKWVPTSTDEPGAGSSNGFVSSESYIQSHTSSSAGSWITKSFSKEPGLYLSNTAVPEPHEYALMAGLGLIGFGIWRRRMKGTTSASA